MDLKKVNLENTVDAINIDKSLKGLRWVTYMYPNNPNKEIDLINEKDKDYKPTFVALILKNILNLQ